MAVPESAILVKDTSGVRGRVSPDEQPFLASVYWLVVHTARRRVSVRPIKGDKQKEGREHSRHAALGLCGTSLPTVLGAVHGPSERSLSSKAKTKSAR